MLSRVEHEKSFITSESDTFEFIVCLSCNTPDRQQRKTFLTTGRRSNQVIWKKRFLLQIVSY